ncbi:MAG TPA: HAD family phosphatase [Verrucomicrobiae bacterium]|nr:HAD family phosphatase [Verrucomicrobiae bacterium]
MPDSIPTNGATRIPRGASPLSSGLALIFDMDGVLIDSNPLHREAWTAFNRRYGLETTDAMLERMYGKRNDDIVRDYFGESLSPAEVERRGAEKEELYRQMVGDRVEAALVPGIRSFLQRYTAAPMALASNAEPQNVYFLLDRAGLRNCFRAVLDGSQVSRPKPDPEIYLLASRLLGVAPANCIVFEDSPSGVQAAVTAGMRVIGLLTTYGNLPNARICVDNFRSGDLESWLAAQVVAE